MTEIKLIVVYRAVREPEPGIDVNRCTGCAAEEDERLCTALGDCGSEGPYATSVTGNTAGVIFQRHYEPAHR